MRLPPRSPPVTATGVNGRALSKRGRLTRKRLLEAAEQVFCDLGYHEASIVKITEAAGVAQGTFYLYFEGKQEIFEDVALNLNERLRHALSEAAAGAATRREAEELGLRAFLQFTADNPALYRVMRQAEFVARDALRDHYERVMGPYARNLEVAMGRGEIAVGNPHILAFVLGGAAEVFGMRQSLWPEDPLSEEDIAELVRILWRTVGGTSG